VASDGNKTRIDLIDSRAISWCQIKQHTGPRTLFSATGKLNWVTLLQSLGN
jgi:hypothetical protein